MKGKIVDAIFSKTYADGYNMVEQRSIDEAADAVMAIKHPTEIIYFCKVMPDKWSIHRCHTAVCKHYHQNESILEMDCRKSRPATIKDLIT